MNEAAAKAMRFEVRFHGVRVGLPRVGPEPSAYGGNTACVEVRCGDRLLIFDAGTGIRALGAELAADAPLDADIFFSSLRYDHLCGLPFFAPVYNPQNTFRLWAGPDRRGDLDAVLKEMMSGPLFPIPPTFLGAVKGLTTLDPGAETTPVPGVTVRAVPLNGSTGATSYRVAFDARSLVYLCGPVPRPEREGGEIRELLAGADLVIYGPALERDAAPGWREGVRLCDAAGAGKLVIFHHVAACADEDLDRAAEALAGAFPGGMLAREGMQVMV